MSMTCLANITSITLASSVILKLVGLLSMNINASISPKGKIRMRQTNKHTYKKPLND